MITESLTLTDFLLARIAEDEADAGEVEWDGGRCQTNTGAHYDTARVLAECEAKRRIIDHAFDYGAMIDGEWGCCHDVDAIRAGSVPKDCYGPRSAREVLVLLALPYADHELYREEWKP